MQQATEVGDGESMEKEDAAEDGPAGVSGTLRETRGAEGDMVSTMAVVALRVDGIAAAAGGELGVPTRRGGGRKGRKKKLSMIGTGLTKGIWPMAISTEVADVAARCTEGQAFIQGM
jgi:hypothetical protein